MMTRRLPGEIALGRGVALLTSGVEAGGFGRWLNAERRARGMSQADLAEAAEVSQEYVAMLEREARRPSRAVTEKLAKALTRVNPVTPQTEAFGTLRRAMRAAGFDSPQGPEMEALPVLPERVSELPPSMQEALRYILGLDGEVREFMIKLWLEQARPHLEMQAELDRRREQVRREIEALGPTRAGD